MTTFDFFVFVFFIFGIFGALAFLADYVIPGDFFEDGE